MATGSLVFAFSVPNAVQRYNKKSHPGNGVRNLYEFYENSTKVLRVFYAECKNSTSIQMTAPYRNHWAQGRT